jgi:copper transport protein
MIAACSRPIRKSLFALIALALIGALFLPQGRASAHASLESSEPEAGAALMSAPKEVALHFTESIDASFSTVQLLDVGGNVVVKGPGQIHPKDDHTLRLALTPLPDGVYSAYWQVRSQVDGHLTAGIVSFSVGASASQVSLLLPEGVPDPASALPLPLDALTRWLNYLCVALAGGSAAFAMLVWRPVYQRTPETAAADQFMSLWLKRLMWIGSAGVIALSLIFALEQTALAAGGLEFGKALIVYVSTRSGLLILLRVALLIVLMALAARLTSVGTGAPEWGWLALGVGTQVLLTFSLQSHNAATGDITALLVDWSHIAAMSAWIGGLPGLLIALRVSRRPDAPADMPPLSRLIPRFSRLAMISVDVLAASGVVSLWLQVRNLDALTQTTYGGAVLIKTGLFGLLLGLGALNLLVITPRLSDPASRIGGWIGRSVPLEIGLGIVLLVMVGAMTGVAPAYEALAAQHRLGFTQHYVSEGVGLTLRIAPVRAGDNEFGLDVEDPRPGADSVEGQVTFRIGLVNQGLADTRVEVGSPDGKRFSIRGTYFPLGGRWKVQVILRRKGFNVVQHVYFVDVPVPDQASGVPLNAAGESLRPNPIQPDEASVAAGKALYTTNCVPCHGVSGKGDGPVGLSLNPRPADLTQHAVVGMHTDGQLFEWISGGFPGSAMQGFAEYLSETERWNLVNYIRTLGQ